MDRLKTRDKGPIYWSQDTDWLLRWLNRCAFWYVTLFGIPTFNYLAYILYTR